LATEILWEFVWNRFCDWYIEMSKPTKAESLPTLWYCLTAILKLLHPFMPFITEEIWALLHESAGAKAETLLIRADWPTAVTGHIDLTLNANVDLFCELVREIRHARKAANIPLSAKCDGVLACSDPVVLAFLTDSEDSIKTMAKMANLTFHASVSEAPDQSAAVVVGNIQLWIPLAGLIDIEKEIARLEKQSEKIQAELADKLQRLSNETFVSKAPPRVVEDIRNQQLLLQEELKQVSLQLQTLRK